MPGDETGSANGGKGRDIPCCWWHESVPATAMCVSCARPVCAQCDRRYGYRHYCPQCFPQPPAAYPYVVPPPPMVPTLEPEPTDERERRWWRADWGVLEVVIALLIVFGIYNAFGLLLYLITEDRLLFSYVAYAVFFCPLIALSIWVIVWQRHGRGRKELGLQWGKPARTLAYGGLGTLTGLVMSYGAFFLIFLIFYLIAGRGPVSGETEQMQGLGSGYLAIVLLVVVILAPIFEELFFRGLFYPALRRVLGPRPAIVLDGVIFGLLHFEPLFMISLILVGMMLAYLYEKTDSLAAPIIAHSLYNLTVVLIALAFGW